MRLLAPFRKAASKISSVPMIGIDISDHTVKFIQLKKRAGKISVRAHGGTLMEAETVVDGEIKDKEGLVRALKELRVKGDIFGNRFVVASLPEEKSFIRIIKVPRVKIEELKNTVMWGLEGNIPLPLEEIYFHYEVVSDEETSKDHYDVLTVAFPRGIVDSYADAIKKAGLTPYALEVESQSLARALFDRNNPKDSQIIADIGASRTSFVLISKGSIALTSTIQVSGADFHKLIAKACSVSITDAERMKQEAGLLPVKFGGKVGKALEPALEELVKELEKHIEYYENHISGLHEAPKDIRAVVITGGEASMPGLDAFLSRRIRKPVLVGDAFQALRRASPDYLPPIPRNEALQFATAVGLTLRNIDI